MLLLLVLLYHNTTRATMMSPNYTSIHFLLLRVKPLPPMTFKLLTHYQNLIYLGFKLLALSKSQLNLMVSTL